MTCNVIYLTNLLLPLNLTLLANDGNNMNYSEAVMVTG